MTPGRIVLVDWRDALPGSAEPSKARPAIVIGSSFLFSEDSPTRIVVPLTGSSTLAIPGASLEIVPSQQNYCTKTCYALAWNVQSIPTTRLHEARGRVTDDELALVRALVARCVDATGMD